MGLPSLCIEVGSDNVEMACGKARRVPIYGRGEKKTSWKLLLIVRADRHHGPLLSPKENMITASMSRVSGQLTIQTPRI